MTDGCPVCCFVDSGRGREPSVSERRSEAMHLRRYQEGVRARRIPSLVLLVLASSVVLFGCGTNSGLGSMPKVAPSTTQPAPPTTPNSPVTSIFDPQGATNPSDGALGFINAEDNEDAATTCDFISAEFLREVAEEINVDPHKPCADIMSAVFNGGGPQPIPPQEESPSVVSVQQTGVTAQVVIDFNVPANDGATLANDNITLTLQNGRWLVSDAGG
jgi:hypothetical protein